MLIGTRFRQPTPDQARYITDYLNAGKPVLGIRTSTHAFKGKGSFGDLSYDNFGLKILGETWVSHHGQHKKQGGRGVIEGSQAFTPFFAALAKYLRLRTSTGWFICRKQTRFSCAGRSPSHSIQSRRILRVRKIIRCSPLPGCIPISVRMDRGLGTRSAPLRALRSISSTRISGVLVVNAAYLLTGREVPDRANVDYVDSYYPSFYGFIKDATHWKNANVKRRISGWERTVASDPPNSPDWPYRDRPTRSNQSEASHQAKPPEKLELRRGERIALVGGSLAERMNLFGYFETMLHTRFPDKELLIRNFVGQPIPSASNSVRKLRQD